jgi:hypothetical protein
VAGDLEGVPDTEEFVEALRQAGATVTQYSKVRKRNLAKCTTTRIPR